MLLRYETAAFVAGLLDPVGVRAISKVSSSIVHKTHYTSVIHPRVGREKGTVDLPRLELVPVVDNMNVVIHFEESRAGLPTPLLDAQLRHARAAVPARADLRMGVVVAEGTEVAE